MPADEDQTTAVALGDVDGDGDLDLAAGNVFRLSRIYINLRRQLDAPFVLRWGRSYRIDVYARHGPARLADLALAYFSSATANIPLPPFGRLGIDPNSMTALSPFLVPQPGGVGSLSIKMPSLPALAGVAVHIQALLVQYPVGARLTNVNTDVILR